MLRLLFSILTWEVQPMWLCIFSRGQSGDSSILHCALPDRLNWIEIEMHELHFRSLHWRLSIPSLQTAGQQLDQFDSCSWTTREPRWFSWQPSSSKTSLPWPSPLQSQSTLAAPLDIFLQLKIGSNPGRMQRDTGTLTEHPRQECWASFDQGLDPALLT